jgi:LEA14-like dessication related protein
LKKINLYIVLSIFVFTGCVSQITQIADNIDVELENVNPKISSAQQGVDIVNSVLGVITGKPGKKGDLEVDVLLNVKNNNSFALDISRMSYNFFVNDEEVGKGLADDTTQQLRIDPGQEKTITLPLTLGMDKIFDKTLKALLEGNFNARVKGVVTVNTFVGKIPIPYSVSKDIKTR